MIKHLLLVVFVITANLSFSQDRLILTSLDTLNVKVIKSSPNDVEFTYPDEESINVLPKNRIFKIEYSSGRIEVVRSHEGYPDQVTQKRSAKPTPNVVPRFRWGFRAGINQPLIGGLDNGSTNRLGGMAGASTELKFINTRHSIILDAYINQMYAKSPDGNDAFEIVYISFPLVYGISLNKWFTLLGGIEPSFTVYSDYYQSGSYYDASPVTSSSVFGITAGGRFMVLPNTFYIDVRGVGGVTDMFTFGGNLPSKINLSLGYYIKY